jgi:hypothetical protein
LLKFSSLLSFFSLNCLSPSRRVKYVVKSFLPRRFHISHTRAQLYTFEHSDNHVSADTAFGNRTESRFFLAHIRHMPLLLLLLLLVVLLVLVADEVLDSQKYFQRSSKNTHDFARKAASREELSAFLRKKALFLIKNLSVYDIRSNK